MSRETAHQRRVLQWLNQDVGAYAINIHGHEMQESGVLDIMGCFEGKFFSIEMKIPGNKPSKLQEYHMERITAAKGFTFVAYSLEEVQAAFVQAGWVSEEDL